MSDLVASNAKDENTVFSDEDASIIELLKETFFGSLLDQAGFSKMIAILSPSQK